MFDLCQYELESFKIYHKNSKPVLEKAMVISAITIFPSWTQKPLIIQLWFESAGKAKNKRHFGAYVNIISIHTRYCSSIVCMKRNKLPCFLDKKYMHFKYLHFLTSARKGKIGKRERRKLIEFIFPSFLSPHGKIEFIN